MGGAAGHMAHPFDLSNIRTGDDLIDFFERAAVLLTSEAMSVKIDGVNVSFKVVGDEENKQFAVDRGSTKPIDIEGITLARVGERFPKGHGMRPAITSLLTILNASIENLKPELIELGMWDDSTIFLNTEYVVGTTNVTQYDQNFLAIHGVNRFYEKTNARTGITRPGLSRPEDEKAPSVEIKYDPGVLERFAEKIRPIAKEMDFEVFTSVPTSKIEDIDIDFSATLNEPFTVVFNEDDAITKSLGEWLREINNPKGINIKIYDNDKLKKIAALSKQVYLSILDGYPVTSFIPDKDDVKPAIEAAVFYHATRELGNDVLRALTSPMGDVTSHEGVVLRHKSLGPQPVKITGEFIVGGMTSGFRESTSTTLEEFSINDSPDLSYKTPKKQNIIVVYPGRFQPMGQHHAAAFRGLQEEFGKNNVYIVTSDVVSLPKSPFNFEEKKKIITAHGIPEGQIIQVKNPYAPLELLSNLPTNTVVLFAVGDKDMRENPRFKVGTKKSGEPSYFRYYKNNIDNLESYENHGYLTVLPHQSLDIGEYGEMSGTTLRKALATANEQTFEEIMGFYSEEIYNMIKEKLTSEVRESFSLPFLESLVEETLLEVYSEKQRRWACSQIKNPRELTTAQAKEMCYSKEIEEKEEDLEEISAMSAGSVSGVSNNDDIIIRQENKNYKLFRTDEKGNNYMTSREDILAEKLLRELVRKAIRKTQNKILKEEQMLRSVVRNLLKEEAAKQTIYPYTSLNVLAEFIKNQVYKPTSNFKSAYMTLSSSKEDRERFLQHILDLAREDMSRMDMNLEPLEDPDREMKEKEAELEKAAEETEEKGGPIHVTMKDLDDRGGIVGDEEEIVSDEDFLQEEEEELLPTDTQAERDAVRNFANETYKGFGSALRRFYERVPDNIVRVNIGGEERDISERELFATYLEKNLIAHASMAEQYMDSEESLTTSVPGGETEDINMEF